MMYKETKNFWRAVLIVLSLMVGVFVFISIRSYLNNEAFYLFKEDVNKIRDNIIGEAGLAGYVGTLENLRGLFAASKTVERNEWSSFITNSKHSPHLTDINTFAYIRRISEGERAAVIKSIQEDTSTNQKGYPQFSITPEGRRYEYYVTTYVEPEKNNEASLGTDMLTTQATQAAIERARDTGGFATTPVFYINEKPYITAYLPIYQNGTLTTTTEERRAAIQGVVATRVNLEKLFNSILAQSIDANKIYVGLYDTQLSTPITENNVIYKFGQDFNTLTKFGGIFEERVPFTLGNINWTLRVIEPSSKHIGAVQIYFPPIAGLGATILCVLLGGMFLALQVSKDDVLILAKELNKKLMETELRLFQTAPDSIIALDKRGNFTYANEAAIKTFGRTLDEVRGKNFANIGALTKGAVSSVTPLFLQLINGRQVAPFDLKIIQKSGNMLDVEASASIVRENNEIIGVQVILRDITERKQYERELANRLIDLQKFKLAVESASDHIVITDSEGVVQFANTAAEKITGYTKEEMIGKKAGKLWGSLMPKEFYKNFWDVIKIHKKPFTGEIRNKRKNGEEYVALVDASPILDENGDIRFFVAIERDITKEKAIDRAKTEFVSLASHQLRTPLTTITWYAEMLLGGDVGEITEKQRLYIEEIYGGGRRLVSLVNALLSVSRIELGTFSVEPEPSDIVTICEITIKELAPTIEKKGVELTTSFEKNLPKIQVDKNLTKIVFQNIISNAVEYTHEHGKILVVIKKEGENMVFSVTDNGIGIPAAMQPKIFEKLFRADNAIEMRTDGTGLGLYVVKAIVDQSGGKIWFTSKEGEGTTFYVTIPFSGMMAKKGEKKLTPFS